jgi:uncharacterized protein YqjF (DUF2071 family)
VVAIDEYLALRKRPEGPPAMYQRWRDLTFLHFSTEPEEIQALLPDGLMVDTFPNERGEEMAWVGLVPFRMEGVRHRRSPEIPGCHAFPETNVRTYVHRDGKSPGVWFFSLDASNATACLVARRTFNLPYFPARMSVQRSESAACYKSSRWRKPGAAADRTVALQVAMELGTKLALPSPGTLAFFLVERYLLYAEKLGRLYTGQVNHVPYPVREAQIVQAEENLVAAAGIHHREWEHVLFSEGVDVEVFGIRPIG